MIKIIKNNTASEVLVSDTGVAISANGQYTIPPQDYLLWAASADIVTKINDNTLTVNDGNIDYGKTQGIAYLKLEEREANIIYVRKNPGYGDFSSIAAAIASITDNSSTNQYLIQVGPGVYTEPQIVMKNFVSIQGVETQSCIVQPSDPTNHLFIGAAATIRFLTIRGVTTAGKAGIYSTASGLQVRNTVIRDNPINILVEGVSSLASITCDDCIFTGVFTTGIQLKNSGAGVQGVCTDTLFNAISASSGAKCAVLEGSSVSFLFQAVVGSGVNTVECLTVKNGASLKVQGAEIKGFNRAIWVENSGSAPSVDVLSLNADGNIKDVQCDHATATGSINGIMRTSAITNSAPNLHLHYQDFTTGDFEITGAGVLKRHVDVLKSIATPFESNTYTAVYSDTSAYLITGSSSGQSFKLPDATNIRTGFKVTIYNQSSEQIAIKDNAGNTIFDLGQTSIAYFMLQTNGSAAGGWIGWQIFTNVASGIVFYKVVSTTPFTTSSTSDVLITSFSITPSAGTYAVWYSANVTQTNGTGQHHWSIYKAGSKIADSERSQRAPASNTTIFQMTQTVLSVDGTQAVDVRVRTNIGSITINNRSLILIRLGGQS